MSFKLWYSGVMDHVELQRIAVEARKKWDAAREHAYDGTYEQQSHNEKVRRGRAIDEAQAELELAERACEEANLATNRYDLSVIADQTFVLYCESMCNRPDCDLCSDTWTVHHDHTKLFTSREDAEAQAKSLNLDPDDFSINIVVDETEFKSREDTW